ncbi:MAG: hypothetical protein LBD77_03845 [Bifidobacteriaceae bacterium]|jgi:hypothetical protein|nr:hypothetical protein [Bifidobacteriaceae bacterium]
MEMEKGEAAIDLALEAAAKYYGDLLDRSDKARLRSSFAEFFPTGVGVAEFVWLLCPEAPVVGFTGRFHTLVGTRKPDSTVEGLIEELKADKFLITGPDLWRVEAPMGVGTRVHSTLTLEDPNAKRGWWRKPPPVFDALSYWFEFEDPNGPSMYFDLFCPTLSHHPKLNVIHEFVDSFVQSVEVTYE